MESDLLSHEDRMKAGRVLAIVGATMDATFGEPAASQVPQTDEGVRDHYAKNFATFTDMIMTEFSSSDDFRGLIERVLGS